MTVSAEEFLRRFLLCTLPRGFVHIRSFGFLAGPRRASMLALARHAGLRSSHPVLDQDAERLPLPGVGRTHEGGGALFSGGTTPHRLQYELLVPTFRRPNKYFLKQGGLCRQRTSSEVLHEHQVRRVSVFL